MVVTYHPDAGLSLRLAGIARQVGAVVVVDNGSDEDESALLQDAAADPKVTLIRNHENLGVARALNIGIRRAAALGFDWVLLLDQDSIVADDLAQALFDIRGSFPDADRLAVVGAGFGAHAAAPGDEPWEEVESVITSGSLLPLAAFAAIGPFREEFFIDYVDTEFCLRARSLGYRVINARRALMAHEIGAPTRHRILWIGKSTTNHSADRRYYIARNDTVLLREYGRYRFGAWALKSLKRRLRTCKRVLLYEDDKLAKIAAIGAGWRDGVRNRLGPRPARRLSNINV